jgi:hypothetical protein
MFVFPPEILCRAGEGASETRPTFVGELMACPEFNGTAHADGALADAAELLKSERQNDWRGLPLRLKRPKETRTD